MGAVGPRRVAFLADGTLPEMPARLVENESSGSRSLDLVFVDPVGTGFSRIIENEKKGDDKDKKAPDDAPDPKEYFGYKRDLESLCEFMGRWLSDHGRWGSPVFIAGESYGGYRVGRLARLLQESTGIERRHPHLAGARDRGAEPDRLRRPRLGRSRPDDGRRRRASRALACVPQGDGLAKVLRESEEFATGDYASFLTRGAAMPAKERGRRRSRLADSSGSRSTSSSAVRGASPSSPSSESSCATSARSSACTTRRSRRPTRSPTATRSPGPIRPSPGSALHTRWP